MNMNPFEFVKDIGIKQLPSNWLFLLGFVGVIVLFACLLLWRNRKR